MSVITKQKAINQLPYSPEDFLKRNLGDNIELAHQQSHDLAAGIRLACYDVIDDTISKFPEGKTYFSFCPIGDEEFYILLTFFPEMNPKRDNDIFRVTRLVFAPQYFQQWDYSILKKKQPFQFDRKAEQSIVIPPCCYEPISHLSDINTENSQDFSLILQRKEAALFLLRTSLDAFLNANDADKIPACSFLSHSAEREKVLEAHEIIMANLETPKTIRELSRKVGMNECYLKKGFKVTYGKTIHELQQYERIEKAKKLLKAGKYTVNEVAFKMGFGSASHFSSSFKKISGIKPCELLG